MKDWARYGKAALVAMVDEPDFANLDSLPPSGAGGTKILEEFYEGAS